MPALRICTVTDGLDAVLQVALLLSSVGDDTTRTDLRLNAAQEALGKTGAEDFDLIVLAATDDGRSPDMLREVARIAVARGATVLLRGPDATLPEGLPPDLGILRGPPFPAGSLGQILAAAAPVGGTTAAFRPELGTGSGPRVPLRRLIARLAGQEEAVPPPLPPDAPQVHVIQPTCGGAGSTTLSVNFAVALAERAKLGDGRTAVCVLDLNLQFGSVGTYFNLPENSQLRDAYRNIRRIDAEVFQSCLQYPAPGVAVLQTPAEIMPFDALTAASVGELIALARGTAPLVIVDMPHCIADWAEQVFVEADQILCVSTLDVRCARNARLLERLLAASSATRTPPEHVLNRAPSRRSREWEENRTAFETAIGRPLCAVFSDGGAQVAASCDEGNPLCSSSPKTALAQEIRAFVGRFPMPLAQQGER